MNSDTGKPVRPSHSGIHPAPGAVFSIVVSSTVAAMKRPVVGNRCDDEGAKVKADTHAQHITTITTKICEDIILVVFRIYYVLTFAQLEASLH
jgi:hypothetical protein